MLPGPSLEREGNEVAESFLRHEVLGGEEPVVAREVNFHANGHGLAEQTGPEPPSHRCLNRLLQEDPHVRPVARPRPLKTGRDAGAVAHFEKGQGVKEPRAFVEVAGQKVAAVPVDQRVHPGDDAAREVLVDDRVIYRRVAARRLVPRPAPARGYG